MTDDTRTVTSQTGGEYYADGRRVSRDAVLINVGDQHWIPLSLLHTLDERALVGGDRLTCIRIADWKVRALGLPIQQRER